MRISDWSSDVCSSDLIGGIVAFDPGRGRAGQFRGGGGPDCKHAGVPLARSQDRDAVWRQARDQGRGKCTARRALFTGARLTQRRITPRSEEGGVGKGCVRTCEFRWEPLILKKKKMQHRSINR